jgi:hypothetical protein
LSKPFRSSKKRRMLSIISFQGNKGIFNCSDEEALTKFGARGKCV